MERESGSSRCFVVANNVRMKSSAEAAVYVKCNNWTNCVFYSGKHLVVVLQNIPA